MTPHDRYGDMPPWGEGPDPQKVHGPDGYEVTTPGTIRHSTPQYVITRWPAPPKVDGPDGDRGDRHEERNTQTRVVRQKKKQPPPPRVARAIERRESHRTHTAPRGGCPIRSDSCEVSYSSYSS